MEAEQAKENDTKRQKASAGEWTLKPTEQPVQPAASRIIVEHRDPASRLPGRRSFGGFNVHVEVSAAVLARSMMVGVLTCTCRPSETVQGTITTESDRGRQSGVSAEYSKR